MTRLLAAAALGLGLLATSTPANACAWEYCAGTSVVCAEFGCPVWCTPNVPVADRRVCVL